MYNQLKLFEFFEHLEEGVFTEYPVGNDDIGGELLAILSHGLYTNPLDAIREYVQNAVDAKATEVIIHVTGNSVWILDDGTGMSATELHDARKFGVSKKSITEHVGFRGIGIYSGFDLCDTLRITTKQAQAEAAYVLEFNFGTMKEKLERARRNPDRPAVPLLELLTGHTHFGIDRDTYPQEKSFTLVQLDNINDVHIRRLSNRQGLREYVLLNLPIDFDQNFEYRKQINAGLRQYVVGYNPIRVILRSDDKQAEIIVKPNIPNLAPPLMVPVRNSRGKAIAFYWACLTNGSEKISAQNSDFSDFEGFVYKIRGFTIGDREKLKKFWGSRKPLYHWYTGEVYVLDEDIIPNAERDDFETGSAKTVLETALEGVFLSNDRSLYDIAADSQVQRRAIQKLNEASDTLADLELQITQQTHDALAVYSELETINRGLKRYRNQAPRNYTDIANNLIERVELLRTSLRKEVEEGIPVSEQKKLKTAKAPFGKPRPTAEAGEDRTEDLQDEQIEPPEKRETTLKRVPTLIGVFEDLGWELDESCQTILKVIQDALTGVLGEKSQEYRDILDYIESQVTDELEE